MKNYLFKNVTFYSLNKKLKLQMHSIRALSAHSAADFNSSPGRWQQVWLVAIVPPDRWGKMDKNDCHTAWGSLISSLHHSKNYACSFSLIDFLFFLNVVYLFFWLSIAIYQLQVATFLPLAWVAMNVFCAIMGYTKKHKDISEAIRDAMGGMRRYWNVMEGSRGTLWCPERGLAIEVF
jgi:hypothetical protein